MKRIRMVWTCSDYVKHYHSTYIGAWLCGRVQAFRAMLQNIWDKYP